MKEQPGPVVGSAPLLRLRGIRAGYGAGDVLHGVDLQLGAGEVAAVLGPNGAGKSTLLSVVAGFLRPRSGAVELWGRSTLGHGPAELSRCGVYHVPEGRAVFPNLSVSDNIRMATARPERQWRDALAATLELFPRLAERSEQRAGTLSGGEQQMLALARAFAARPALLLLDEPSLGLAPRIVDEVFETIERFRRSGIAVVLVEQYVHRALALADRVLVLSKGSVRFHGPATAVDTDALVHDYLGYVNGDSHRTRRSDGCPSMSTERSEPRSRP